MSLEHSPFRQQKGAAGSQLDPLLTREELAKRWRTTAVSISRKYRALGLKPMRASGRLLFFASNIIEVEQRSANGEV